VRARIERKVAEIQRWVDSVAGVTDWPAAGALAMFRTRPPEGEDRLARWSRRLIPHIWVRPARLKGLSVRISPAELSEFVVYEEVFIEGVYDLDQVAFTPDAIIDCGAFEGYFSLLAATRFPGVPIVAFEPNERNLEGLRANVSRNGVAIEIRAEAISTTDGTATFSGGGCGGRLGEATPESVVVRVSDLRRVIAESRCARLLLKLDIEGEEATLLPALMGILPRQCAIFYEWHQGIDDYRRIDSLLSSQGFITSLTREHRVDDGPLFIDAFAQRA
jgi:FkbM family methyltransferase